MNLSFVVAVFLYALLISLSVHKLSRSSSLARLIVIRSRDPPQKPYIEDRLTLPSYPRSLMKRSIIQ